MSEGVGTYFPVCDVRVCVVSVVRDFPVHACECVCVCVCVCCVYAVCRCICVYEGMHVCRARTIINGEHAKTHEQTHQTRTDENSYKT